MEGKEPKKPHREKLKLKKKPVRGALKVNQTQNLPLRLAIFKTSVSCRQLSLRWQNVGYLSKKPTELVINIYNLTKPMSMKFIVPLTTDWEVPLLLKPGSRYKIVVEAKRNGETVAEGKLFHRAVLVEKEMDQLIQRARDFLVTSNDRKVLVKYFYRNKPADYFDDIHWNFNGIMEPYIKDQNGDQGSVINGQINGLFFSTKVDTMTGMPPLISPFGNTRINIPVDRLMHTNCEIYFADFYCNQKVHYVTLVITEKGSAADDFCRKNLINIGMHAPKNPFLFYDEIGDRFYCCTRLWVEVFYTEAVDINKEMEEDSRVFFSRVDIRGKGTSSPAGIPKNDKCDTCNLFSDHRDCEF